MIDLLSAEGVAAVARLATRRALYAFDFDGTLAPIVDRPDDARSPPGTARLLAELASLVPVVVVTGRGVDDLRARVGFEPAFVVGNHGAEGLPVGLADDRDLAAHRAVVDGWRDQWTDALPVDEAAGVVVEPKAFSLSIHYRHAPDPDRAARSIERAIGGLVPPPRVIGGKCVFNLLPEGAPDKGTALWALLRHTGNETAFFIGDDLTDEAAFAVAADDWVTVHVGGDGETRARYAIATQADIDRCLALLVASAREARAGGPAS